MHGKRQSMDLRHGWSAQTYDPVLHHRDTENEGNRQPLLHIHWWVLHCLHPLKSTNNSSHPWTRCHQTPTFSQGKDIREMESDTTHLLLVYQLQTLIMTLGQRICQ
jgi:hypothetical protein